MINKPETSRKRDKLHTRHETSRKRDKLHPKHETRDPKQIKHETRNAEKTKIAKSQILYDGRIRNFPFFRASSKNEKITDFQFFGTSNQQPVTSNPKQNEKTNNPNFHHLPFPKLRVLPTMDSHG